MLTVVPAIILILQLRSRASILHGRTIAIADIGRATFQTPTNNRMILNICDHDHGRPKRPDSFMTSFHLQRMASVWGT